MKSDYLVDIRDELKYVKKAMEGLYASIEELDSTLDEAIDAIDAALEEAEVSNDA